MNWLCTLLIATVLNTSVPDSLNNMKNDMLKITLGNAAIKAIEARYHENRSWYTNRFKIIDVLHKAKGNRYVVTMEVPSCTIKDLYVRGIDHDDIVTFGLGLYEGIRVLKIEQKY